jgi:hypothetical protein
LTAGGQTVGGFDYGRQSPIIDTPFWVLDHTFQGGYLPEKSRNIVDAPINVPFASLMGEIVADTLMILPSL